MSDATPANLQFDQQGACTESLRIHARPTTPHVATGLHHTTQSWDGVTRLSVSGRTQPGSCSTTPGSGASNPRGTSSHVSSLFVTAHVAEPLQSVHLSANNQLTALPGYLQRTVPKRIAPATMAPSMLTDLTAAVDVPAGRPGPTPRELVSTSVSSTPTPLPAADSITTAPTQDSTVLCAYRSQLETAAQAGPQGNNSLLVEATGLSKVHGMRRTSVASLPATPEKSAIVHARDLDMSFGCRHPHAVISGPVNSVHGFSQVSPLDLDAAASAPYAAYSHAGVIRISPGQPVDAGRVNVRPNRRSSGLRFSGDMVPRPFLGT